MSAPTSPIPKTPSTDPSPGRGSRHAAGASAPSDATGDDPGVGGREPARPDRATGWVLLAGGLVGALGAVVLLFEKLAQLADPTYVPSCSVDPVLSCGSVMRTAQASAFGFPNPIIGVVAFPIVAVIGALVLSRVDLPRWFWLGLQLGATAGIAFVHWLIVETVAVIGALCPYCMLVWAVTIPIFWYTTAHSLAAGHLEFGAAGRFLARHRGVVLAVWYAAVVAVVLASFPAYFGSYVGL